MAADAILSIYYGKWHMTRRALKRPPDYPAGLADNGAPDAFVAPANRAGPAALAELARHGYSEDEIFALVVPKRTLARRKAANERLTVEETDKALRLARIAAQAERVFGEADKAHRWLRKPKRALQGETPLAYLASEAGARVVEEMLHRIEHGVFA
jgi:putative toxin-antitoxin system antitoxin component (TIGR02293 family)